MPKKKSRRQGAGGARRLNGEPAVPAPTAVAGGTGPVNCPQYALDAGEPMPTVQAGAGRRASSSFSHGTCSVGEILDGKPKARHPAKPPFRVPTMAEIAEIPWNGLTVVSTFSGCGGSCTGYRLAGFRAAWANEFVPAAQDSYSANMAEGGHLDCRDIKLVQASDILKRLKMEKGELDLLDGSPPCQSFSTAGKRHKGWGQEKQYEGGHSQLNETLFGEYLRLLRGLMPKVFVAENVSGLVKGTCKGMFLEILAEMKAAGYRVAARVLDAQWLGVPQQRQRVIFVGAREDLAAEPCHPSPLPYRYSVKEAIPWITGMSHNRIEEEKDVSVDGSSPAVRANRAAHLKAGGEPEMIMAGNLRHTLAGRRPSRKLDGVTPTVPQDSLLLPPSRVLGSYGVQEVDPAAPCPTVTISSPGNDLAVAEGRVFVDSSEITDISGYAIGDKWDKLKPGESVYYGGRLWKVASDKPCPTVTLLGGTLSAAAVCHPTERRKFTIAELRRICAFPDDFVLTGSYAQMWERLGNSVPPVMMFWIAKTVRDQILFKLLGKRPWKHDPACLLPLRV